MSPPARPGSLLAVLVVPLLAAGCAEVDTSSAERNPPSSSSPSAAVSYGPSPSPVLTLPPSGYYGVERTPAAPAAPFTLTDQDGERFRFPRDAHGAVTLVYFGYTHCPDICPGTLAGIAVALRDLPASVRDRVDVLFVTVDPARDTSEVIGDYVVLFSKDFVGLTGREERIQGILASFGLPPATRYDLGEGEYGVGHPAGVLAFTPDGSAHLEYPFGVTVEMWQHDLPKLVQEGWEGA
jgi:protein SCO1/2